MYLIKIVIECLILSALFVVLLCVKLADKKWVNILLYTLFSGIGTLLVIVATSQFLKLPYTYWVLMPYIFFWFISFWVYGTFLGAVNKPRKGEDVFTLDSKDGKIEFYYPRDNFTILGGAGSGKTASIGKPLLEQFIKYNWAGFIYDYKDYDYTQTAYNLIEKYDYPYKFYRVNFTDLSRTHRFNILNKEIIPSETFLFQTLTDFLYAVAPAEMVKNDTGGWLNGALGLLKGIAVRFYHFRNEWEKYCTLPHLLNFIAGTNAEQLISFLEDDLMAKKAAGAFLAAGSSDKTRDSYLSVLNNFIANIATNKEICYVLTGNDFVFNLTDPEDPKLFAVANNHALDSLISPIIAMLLPMTTRKINLGNPVKFAFILDEMTTFKVNDFQKMPSVYREYGCSFVILTQSASKFEAVYGRNDKDAILANAGNLFIGKTKDPEALKYYPIFFGKEDREKRSTSAGSSSGRYNSSVTLSKQKEDIYDTRVFTNLKKGEFILSAAESNVDYVRTRFKKFKLKEKPLPIIKLTTTQDINENYDQIERDVEILLTTLCGK